MATLLTSGDVGVLARRAVRLYVGREEWAKLPDERKLRLQDAFFEAFHGAADELDFLAR